ncbi:MAG: RNA repair transcriptional activator RtcR family protein [Planctomycetota bacterium]
MNRRPVVFALLNPERDGGRPGRRWRPTPGLLALEGLPVHRLEILARGSDVTLAQRLAEEAAGVSPQVQVNVHVLEDHDPGDLPAVHRCLASAAGRIELEEGEEVLLHLAPGDRVAQVGMVLLARAGPHAARLLHTTPPPRLRPDLPARAVVLDIEREDVAAPSRAPETTDRLREAVRDLEQLLAAKRAVTPGGDRQAVLEEFLTDDEIRALDLFDRVQLAEVLHVCLDSDTLTEAGKRLFAVSRTRRKTVNDADRVRKYLLRHGISWDEIHGD